MFRLLKERPQGILSMLKMRINRTAPEPGILAMTIHTWSMGKESDEFKPTGYENKEGESIIFENTRPPPGYVSVPAGNVYITRNCRRLTKKSGRSVYATYRSQFPKKRAKQIGLHVPIDVLEQVKSDYEDSKTKVSESLWRMLHNGYPNMPPADKTKVHRLVWSRYLSSQGQSALSRLYPIIYGYHRDSYTPFRFLNRYDSPDKEAISEVHVTVRKAMAFWSGETQCMESHQHEDGAGLPTAQPPEGRTPHDTKQVHTQQPNNHGTEGKHSTRSA